ncbi:MAG: N-acetylmuramoyl-L-alanine amidase, partial [Candidatus Omnitrophota bacterium]
SILLSKSICDVTGDSLDTKVRGVKSANYHVLRGASIPAVLVEVGFLSNSSEERMLKEGSYRQKIAQAIHDGIRDFGQSRDDTGGNNYAAHRGI